jgi:hypothetical protein
MFRSGWMSVFPAAIKAIELLKDVDFRAEP